MKVGDRFLDLDKRQAEYYGHERILTVMEIQDSIAFVESTTNKPGRTTRIQLKYLNNFRLFRPLEKGE